MKRFISVLLLMMLLILPAHAEILPALTLVTPTPSPAPVATEFACEAFIVTLPAGMELVDASALEGYAAAVQSLYPNNGLIQLAAVNPDTDAALCFILMESAQTPLDAATEAALHICGNSDSVIEAGYDANSGALFRHSIDERKYSFYFFSNGNSLLMISASGLDEFQLVTMMMSLDF